MTTKKCSEEYHQASKSTRHPTSAHAIETKNGNVYYRRGLGHTKPPSPAPNTPTLPRQRHRSRSSTGGGDCGSCCCWSGVGGPALGCRWCKCGGGDCGGCCRSMSLWL